MLLFLNFVKIYIITLLATGSQLRHSPHFLLLAVEEVSQSHALVMQMDALDSVYLHEQISLHTLKKKLIINTTYKIQNTY